MTHHCAIYLRQSLDATGDQLAVQRQREDCLNIAKQRKWKVAAEFVDNSISASDARKQRPGYDALVRAFDAGEFDALICYDLDRLTRQPRQLEDWIERADPDRGGSLLLVTANGEADLTTDGGRMFARMKAVVARGEVERKSARQRRAALQRAQQGRPPLGVRLTGYTLAGELIPGEADVVAGLFAAFAAGESLRGLADQMRQSDVPTRHGGKWNPSSVRTMLTNPRYAGRAIYRGEQIDAPAVWPAIVSEDLFTVVQARLSDPRRRTNRTGSTHRKHLGSGLFRCRCGGVVQSWSGSRYRCHAEGHYMRAMGPVDDYVHRVMQARLALPDARGLMSGRSSQRQADLAARATELRTRLAAIAADYDAGLIDGQRYSVAGEKVRADLEPIEQQLATMTGDDAAAEIVAADDPAAAYAAASTMIKRAVIDSLATVTLLPGVRYSRRFDPDSVVITWKGGDDA